MDKGISHTKTESYHHWYIDCVQRQQVIRGLIERLQHDIDERSSFERTREEKAYLQYLTWEVNERRQHLVARFQQGQALKPIPYFSYLLIWAYLWSQNIPRDNIRQFSVSDVGANVQ